MFFGPLEQFENLTILKVKIIYSWLANTFSIFSEYQTLHLSFSIFILSGFIGFFLSIFLFLFLNLQNKLLPSFLNIFFDQFFFFSEQLFQDLITGKEGRQIYFGLFTYLFILLLFLNLSGLIPYTFAFTSHFILTFTLSTIFFCALNATGIYYHGLKIIKLFFPTGTPFFIAPLIISIEIISYFARMFSLAIRLFANITAGHILLKIISWFTYLLFDLFFISFLGMLLITVLWGLELFISILQAYVFLVLLCIYLQDVLHLH